MLARPDAHHAIEPDRAAAIATLEAFVVAHPDHPELTPDAMLRLASLRLDAAEDALLAGDEAAANRASAAAVRALDELLVRFPDYLRRADARYLLAYAHETRGELTDALALYELFAADRTSRYATEAGFRAAELHVDRGELDRAITAYASVAAANDPRLSTVARYKLAWSHYRRGDLTSATVAFQALVDRADAGGDGIASDLRAEAAQYVALCLTEPDFDGDGADDPSPRGAPPGTTATVARIGEHLGDGRTASRREIAELAARALADDARLAEAAATYRLVLAVTTDAAARARVEAALADVAARTP